MGATDVVVLLAIVFNSDNGGLLVGSMSKAFFRRKRKRPCPAWRSSPTTAQQQENPLGVPSREIPQSSGRASEARMITRHLDAHTVVAQMNLLSVASPNKTWAGTAGAIGLGTATALGLGALLQCRYGCSSSVGATTWRCQEGCIGIGSDKGLFVHILSYMEKYLCFSLCTLRRVLAWGDIAASPMRDASSGDDEALAVALGVMSSGELILTGAAVSVVGIVGDLWESLLKRVAGAKVRAGAGLDMIAWKLEEGAECKAGWKRRAVALVMGLGSRPRSNRCVRGHFDHFRYSLVLSQRRYGTTGKTARNCFLEGSVLNHDRGFAVAARIYAARRIIVISYVPHSTASKQDRSIDSWDTYILLITRRILVADDPARLCDSIGPALPRIRARCSRGTGVAWIDWMAFLPRLRSTWRSSGCGAVMLDVWWAEKSMEFSSADALALQF